MDGFNFETLVHQSTQLLCPVTTSIKYEDLYSPRYQFGEDCGVNRSTSSRSCRFSAKGPIETNPTHAKSYQSLELLSNYYHGTYPINVQLPEALPNININTFPERPKFSGNGNDMVQDTCLLIKPSENDSSMKQDLPLQSESDINNNQELNSNFHQVCGSESNTSHQNKKCSDISKETHLHSRDKTDKDLSSSSNINPSSPIVESSSTEHLNSLSSERELKGTDRSTTEPESDPDVIIIKDLHQSASISVKTEGLYSPKKLIRKTYRLNRDLHVLIQQLNKIEDYEIQKSDPIVQKLSPTNSNVPQIAEPRAHRLPDCRLDKSGGHVTLTKKISENYSRTIQTENVDAPIKYLNLNLSHHEKPFRSKFVMVEDLHKLLYHLSKSDTNEYQCLYHEYSRDVNISIFALGVCDTIPLIKTLAKIFRIEILNKFGLVSERKFHMSGVSLNIKFWHLLNYASFTNLRTFGESTKHVIVLVYDVTQNIGVHGVQPEVEFLKFANLPILLVGNTPNLMNENIHSRLLRYKNERLMKDLYKPSTFLELSIESIEDIQGLFITAMDLAFRHRM